MSMIAKNRLKSSWTPLSNEGTNNKLFEERRALVGKWFDKWNTEQRKIVLGDLIDKSKVKQLEFTRDLLQEKCPTMHQDPTRSLPRFLSIYIFSFLDPRSLSRCARVCWYWKYLSELDQLWMPKCLRLGWYVPFTPGPYETGAWKRTYIEHLKSLKVLRPSTHLDLDKLNTDRSRKPPRTRGKPSPPPWRGTDPKPTDIWRNNILDNDDVVDSVVKLRERGNYYSSEAKKITHNARSKVKTGPNVLTKAKRSNSAPRLIETAPPGLTLLDERPKWGSNVQPNTVKFSLHTQTKINGLHTTHGKENGFHSHRQPKVSSPPGRATANTPTATSAREPPTTPLFTQQAWKIPDGDEEDE